MSIFRVKVTQGDRRTGGGNLDTQAQTNTYSVQRTMEAMGPNKMTRKLKDGDTFTDCNYWKQFAYPTMALNDAFIEVVSDDGSVYVQGQPSTFVRTYSKSILTATTHTTTNNIVDIITDNGGYAKWAAITTDQAITVRVNGVTSSDFVVAASSTFNFNNGDILISKLTIANASGSTATVTIQVGVDSKCNS